MADGTLSGNEAYLAGKPCPKCGHVRNAADANPEWQCPKCGVAYLKFRAGATPLRTRFAAGGRELAAEARADRSVYALVAANLLALLIAWQTHIGLRELMLVYWMQSMIIGVCSVIRILCLDRFSAENLRINNQMLTEEPASKFKVAGFFMVHYGGFHFLYMMFLSHAREQRSGGFALGLLLCTIVFAINHGYSLVQNVRRDAIGKPNLGTLMQLPYARIVPMHFTIVLGGWLSGTAFVFFLFAALKIVADVVMHTVEHHVLAKGRVLPRPN